MPARAEEENKRLAKRSQECFFGVPAAGREQIFTATFVHRIAGELIQETWRNADELGRVLQLGARIEPPAT